MMLKIKLLCGQLRSLFFTIAIFSLIYQDLGGNATATPGARGGLQEQVSKLEELSAELEQLVREAGIITRLQEQTLEFKRHADQLQSELQRNNEACSNRRSSYKLAAEIDQNRKTREEQDARRESIRQEIDALTRAQQVLLELLIVMVGDGLVITDQIRGQFFTRKRSKKYSSLNVKKSN